MYCFSFLSLFIKGEAQGAINGVRALTEGFGPLCFGVLMNFFEAGPFPGIPYLAAGALTGIAIAVSFRIPDEEEYQDYLDSKQEPSLVKRLEGARLLDGRGLPNEDGEDKGEAEDGTFKMMKQKNLSSF
jgi:hypothetical protein